MMLVTCLQIFTQPITKLVCQCNLCYIKCLVHVYWSRSKHTSQLYETVSSEDD